MTKASLLKALEKYPDDASIFIDDHRNGELYFATPIQVEYSYKHVDSDRVVSTVDYSSFHLVLED